MARVAPEGLNWAVAGRDAEQVADRAAEHRAPSVVADAFDSAAIDLPAADPRVVISCASPLSRNANALVEACLRHGTRDADLSGELNWVEGFATAHHEAATAAGTMLIPASSLDSVLSDLVVLGMRERHAATGNPLIDQNQVGWQKAMAAGGSGVATITISIPNSPALV